LKAAAIVAAAFLFLRVKSVDVEDYDSIGSRRWPDCPMFRKTDARSFAPKVV
jgi:hypothetical protein